MEFMGILKKHQVESNPIFHDIFLAPTGEGGAGIHPQRKSTLKSLFFLQSHY